MAELIAEFTRHHNVEDYTPVKVFVKDHADALVQAVYERWQFDLSMESARNLIAEAKKKGQSTTQVTLDGDPEDVYDIVVWWEKDRNEINFGVGEGTDGDKTDKYDNVWIHVSRFKPSKKERAKLMKKTKKELVDTLLRVFELHRISVI